MRAASGAPRKSTRRSSPGAAGVRSTRRWRRCKAADVPASRIYSVADMFGDPQFAARGMIEQQQLPDGTALKVPSVVPKLSATPGGTAWLGPRLGEHTGEILSRLGYGAADDRGAAARRRHLRSAAEANRSPRHCKPKESLMLSRATRRSVLLAGAATLLLPALVSAQALEKKKVTIAVGGKNLLYYLPLTVAEQQGYFKAEGLDVEIVDFAGGAQALRAVVGGSADVVSGAFEHTVNMQAKGQSMRAFVLQGRAPQIVLGVNPKTMPNFKSVADLKGKKIGVTAPGSSTNVMANFVLAKAGLKPSDVSFVGVGASQRRGGGDALGPDRRDQQPRPGDHAAAALGRLKIVSDTRVRRRGGQGVRRPDAGGVPVRAQRLHRQEPGHRAGADQRDRARRQVDPGRGPGRHHQGRARELPARRPRGLHRRLPGRQGRAVARRHDSRKGPRHRASRAGQHRCGDRRRQARPAAVYTNEFAKKANAKYPKG